MVCMEVDSYRWKMDSSTNLLHKLTSNDAVCMVDATPGSGVIPATRTLASLLSPLLSGKRSNMLPDLGSTLDIVLTVMTPLDQWSFDDFTCCWF
jgi:hypothetical protein